jgi:hypothetical protein
MSVTWSASAHPAMFADRDCAICMPFSMPTMCMAIAAASAASITLIGTGVLTSVSLFVLLLVVAFLLLVSLVVLISLSGLTGLVLVCLVGLTKGLVPSTAQGD